VTDAKAELLFCIKLDYYSIIKRQLQELFSVFFLFLQISQKAQMITPSMSSLGTPLDNACAENFFSTLKPSGFYRYTPATKEEARLLLDEYIHFCNYERIQLKTKLTPYEKRYQIQEATSF
jgi:transposase InsO family protein